MAKKLSSIRRDYKKLKLDRKHVASDPFVQFEKWMEEALKSDLPEPTAMILSTVSRDGTPSSRVVLLKGVSDGSLFFYTNYESEKGRNLSENPKAAITFFWPELERQINIKGEVQKTEGEVSDEYYSSRPRKSQLGAWASEQGKELSSREELIKKFMVLSLKYVGRKVPRPPFWGGYALKPSTFEFWQGRPNRLHDRVQYLKNDQGDWYLRRLSP